MKRFFTILFLTALIQGLSYSQTIFSNGTGGGDWNNTGTWLGGNVPGISNDVVIAGTDSVQATTGAVCNNLTVLSSGKLATGIDSIGVAGTLELEADAYIFNQTSSPELPGTNFILDPVSNVVHSGSGTIGGENNFEYGNLILRRSSGTTAAADLVINGNLILENSAVGNGFRLVNVDGGTRTGTVYGDVIINTGLFVCVDVGTPDAVGIWNIEGDVYVNTSNSRMGPFSSAGANGLAVFNIAGDLIVNGGRIQVSSSSTHSTGTAMYNIGGDLIMNEGSEVRTNHDGTFAFNFVGAGVQTVRLRGTDDFSVGNDANPIVFYDTIKAGSSVIFDLDTLEWRTLSLRGGNFVVEGSLEMQGISKITGKQIFTLIPGATLKIGSPEGISDSLSSGNIQNDSTRVYSTEAYYEYKGAEQSLGDGLPDTVNGFAVNNASGIILDRNLLVNESLGIISGNLDLNGNIVTLGENGLLNESSGNTVTGSSGMITITKNIGTPGAVNIGGLGAVLTAGSDLGNTTVERYHSAANGSGNSGILRRYNIIPGQNNSALNATLRLYYDESELNGLNESGFQLYKSADGTDNSWTLIGGTVNSAENYVELTGVTDFSFWTIGDIGSTLPVEKDEDYIPSEYALHQNYPNPFNPSTAIKYALPSESDVKIEIFDLLGRKLAEILNEKQSAGVYSINFDASEFSSGIYLYRLTANGTILSKKMILLR